MNAATWIAIGLGAVALRGAMRARSSEPPATDEEAAAMGYGVVAGVAFPTSGLGERGAVFYQPPDAARNHWRDVGAGNVKSLTFALRLAYRTARDAIAQIADAHPRLADALNMRAIACYKRAGFALRRGNFRKAQSCLADLQAIALRCGELGADIPEFHGYDRPAAPFTFGILPPPPIFDQAPRY